MARYRMTMLWLAAVFAIARRSTGPRAAAAIALLALAWSVPNYPASETVGRFELRWRR